MTTPFLSFLFINLFKSNSITILYSLSTHGLTRILGRTGTFLQQSQRRHKPRMAAHSESLLRRAKGASHPITAPPTALFNRLAVSETNRPVLCSPAARRAGARCSSPQLGSPGPGSPGHSSPGPGSPLASTLLAVPALSPQELCCRCPGRGDRDPATAGDCGFCARSASLDSCSLENTWKD